MTLPPLRGLARHALPRLIEGTLAPIAIFYVAYLVLGLWGGLVAGLAWGYGALGWRLARGLPVSGLLVLSTLALTVRTAIALATSSVFVYFLQPTLGTFATAVAFLASVLIGRPLTERLSADLVVLPEEVTAHPAVRRLHRRLTVLWALVFVVNGAIALWFLTSASVGTFLVGKTLSSGAAMLGAVGVSVVWFRRCIRDHQVATAA